MNAKSRTYYTLKNAQVTFIFFVLQIAVGFISRKTFLDFLGADVIGMNTTLSNIMNFINLAEMGIGTAMATALYKPIFDQDHKTMNEMISIQGYFYQKIAYLFIIVSIPLCILFPFIFKDISFPLWYVYATYFVGLWGTILGYMWNYRQILLGADQKNYKLLPYVRGGRLVKIIIQFSLILFFKTGYIWYLVIELLYSTLLAFVINYVVYKEYPWLKLSIKKGKKLLPQYRQLTTMTKQVFFHKVSSFILTETAPLLIFMYVSLSMVTYYGNYMMLVGYAIALVNTVFSGMGASIGNLVAENNKKHIYDVFWELFTSRMWMAAITAFSLYVFIPIFIRVWIGNQYVLSNTTLILVLLNLFISISRSTVDSFKEAYKLFGDIWAPIIEASLNLGCSLLLGYFFGLNGILLGVNISLIIVVLIWKPYYVFKKGFHWPLSLYIKEYFIQLIILIISLFISVKICAVLFNTHADNYYSVVFTTILSSFIFGFISFSLFYILTQGMKSFVIRILRLFHSKS